MRIKQLFLKVPYYIMKCLCNKYKKKSEPKNIIKNSGDLLLEKYKFFDKDKVTQYKQIELYKKRVQLELENIELEILLKIKTYHSKYKFFNNESLMSRSEMIKLLKEKYTKPSWKVRKGTINEYGRQIIISWSVN